MEKHVSKVREYIDSLDKILELVKKTSENLVDTGNPNRRQETELKLLLVTDNAASGEKIRHYLGRIIRTHGTISEVISQRDALIRLHGYAGADTIATDLTNQIFIFLFDETNMPSDFSRYAYPGINNTMCIVSVNGGNRNRWSVPDQWLRQLNRQYLFSSGVFFLLKQMLSACEPEAAIAAFLITILGLDDPETRTIPNTSIALTGNAGNNNRFGVISAAGADICELYCLHTAKNVLSMQIGDDEIAQNGAPAITDDDINNVYNLINSISDNMCKGITSAELCHTLASTPLRAQAAKNLDQLTNQKGGIFSAFRKKPAQPPLLSDILCLDYNDLQRFDSIYKETIIDPIEKSYSQWRSDPDRQYGFFADILSSCHSIMTARQNINNILAAVRERKAEDIRSRAANQNPNDYNQVGYNQYERSDYYRGESTLYEVASAFANINYASRYDKFRDDLFMRICSLFEDPEYKNTFIRSVTTLLNRCTGTRDVLWAQMSKYYFTRDDAVSENFGCPIPIIRRTIPSCLMPPNSFISNYLSRIDEDVMGPIRNSFEANNFKPYTAQGNVGDDDQQGNKGRILVVAPAESSSIHYEIDTIYNGSAAVNPFDTTPFIPDARQGLVRRSLKHDADFAARAHCFNPQLTIEVAIDIYKLM